MAYLSDKQAAQLRSTTELLAYKGKGLLAADESTGTIKKRFDNINVENTEANRTAYRELVFKTKSLGEHISGCILFEETLYQKNAEGEMLVNMLKNQNIIPGIKVDKGLVTLYGTQDEKSTQGLDGLEDRCREYYKAGARFAKWRAVLSIDKSNNKPSQLSINDCAQGLARYASICQTCGLVPIVEPEILTDGNHSIEDCAQVMENVLSTVFKALQEHNVLLEGALLKPNMVTQGSDCKQVSSPERVAELTIRTLRRACPVAIGGVMFLSGGQSEVDASIHLNAINKHPGAEAFFLSFSYGRALQASVLQAWGGKPENVGNAQTALMIRAKANSDAQLGKFNYSGSDEKNSLFEKNYAY